MSGTGTTSVHGPDEDGPREGPVTPPIQRTSTYRFASTDDLVASADAGAGFYTRYGHANFDVVESKFAALHGAEAAVLFASGMGGMAAVLQSTCRAGDRVVALADVYGGTRALLDRMAERGWIDVEYVPFEALDRLAERLSGARLFLGESPTNPLLRVLDVPAVADATRSAGVPFVLDATFAGPANLSPLAHGADLVLESATKSLGGHSDLMGGLVAGTTRMVDALKTTRKLFGAVPDPETAWLLDRGLKTYAVRAERQRTTALDLALWLEGHARVERVWYPGLRSHPEHDVATRLGQGGGSMLAFTVPGGGDAAVRVADGLRLIANAPSLGGVESLACLPRFTSHASMTAEARHAVGVTDDLVRLSVGLEDLADLQADIDQALGAI